MNDRHHRNRVGQPATRPSSGRTLTTYHHLTFDQRLTIARRMHLGAERPRVPRVPLGFGDQLHAARRDTIGRFGAITQHCLERGGFTHHQQPYSDEVYDTWVAAVLGCRPCSHVAHMAGPMMLTADLNRRRLTCEPCTARWTGPLDHDLCEVCGRPGERFIETSLTIGSTCLVFGNVGDCCWAATGVKS